MKKRNGFVSNSSSSSFIISKKYLSPSQIESIKNHSTLAKTYGIDCDDPWFITENEFTIDGSTSMDNFDIYEFLELINVPKQYVKRNDF